MSTSITYTTDSEKPKRCGYEWRTDIALFGTPLIHIAWGINSQKKRLTAQGILAIGQYAKGGLVISQFGVGVVCISQFGIGFVSLSQFGIAFAVASQFGIAFTGVGQYILTLIK